MNNGDLETVQAKIDARLRAPTARIAQKVYLRSLDVAMDGKEVEALVDDFTTRHAGVSVTSLDDMVRTARAVHELAKNNAPLDEIKEAALEFLDVYKFT